MKLCLWLFLSIASCVISIVICRRVKETRKKKRLRNFSDSRYVIGAAIVNMERAILYDDLDNFKFFARYAIRTCLGMAKAYPPEEPSAAVIKNKLIDINVPPRLIARVLEVYDNAHWCTDDINMDHVLSKVRDVVRELVARS